MENKYKRRQKIYINAYAFLCLVMIVGFGFYSYKKWLDYDYLKSYFTTNEALAKDLGTFQSDEQNNYEEAKQNFKEFNENLSKTLVTIFPSSEQYTELTKKMDEIESDLSTPSNPIEISNLVFQKPIKMAAFSILPFRITVKSSDKNFMEFLNKLESSGSVDSNLRLMDVTSIKLNFEEDQADPDAEKLIDFTLQVNAYFQ
ncbi:MAG: hypothetical protein WC269_01180 [Candidatus Gracilibacteria bacterium]|jgi:exoribonuclease R